MLSCEIYCDQCCWLPLYWGDGPFCALIQLLCCHCAASIEGEFLFTTICSGPCWGGQQWVQGIFKGLEGSQDLGRNAYNQRNAALVNILYWEERRMRKSRHCCCHCMRVPVGVYTLPSHSATHVATDRWLGGTKLPLKLKAPPLWGGGEWTERQRKLTVTKWTGFGTRHHGKNYCPALLTPLEDCCLYLHIQRNWVGSIVIGHWQLVSGGYRVRLDRNQRYMLKKWQCLEADRWQCRGWGKGQMYTQDLHHSVGCRVLAKSQTSMGLAGTICYILTHLG